MRHLNLPSIEETPQNWSLSPERVREVRERLGWSMRRLALVSGLSVDTVIALEGVGGSRDEVDRVLKAFRRALRRARWAGLDEA